MAVQINVAANQAALTASIQAGVQAYNQRFAQNNQINLSINQRGFSQPLGRITGDVKDFEAALAASNARVIAFGASTAVLGGVIRSFKELANVTIEVEKNLADINRVFGLTTSQLQKFSTDLFNVTKLTASSFDEASKAALEFSRQGLKAEETLQRTKDALTLTRLAGISTANAVDALTSTVNGFAATGISTTQILNKLVAVEQDYAVGAGDLAEALSRTGQAAQEAGVSLDQLNALVTSAQQSTARGGAVIGNALKTIFTRLQRTDTLDQLEAFNISVRDVQGNILPAVQILQNFAGAYKGLADAQRAQLSEQVAGVYQVNILKAIVNDLNKSQGTYAGALQRGAAATNEAEVATAKLNQTLDALLKQTATSTQQLANNIGKVTFEPLAKYGAEQLKSFVESMNEVLEGEGVGSTFANGLLKGIRNVIAGPGAIAAFFTLFKLIQNSFTYLSQALPQIAGITTETQNRKNIEQSILQIMQQQGPVSQALAGNMGNQAAQAQLLLQLARQQTAEYQMQTTLAKQLAVQLAGQGVRVKGSGGLQVTRAGGYIPNATKMAEVVGAQAGGYTPGRVVSSPVGGVMNTAEDVKYIPGFAQPFINPPAGSKAGRAHRQNAISRTGVDPYMYRGFIPNFFADAKKSKLKQSLERGRDFEKLVGKYIGEPPSWNGAVDFKVVPNIPDDTSLGFNKGYYDSGTFADAHSGLGHTNPQIAGKIIRHSKLTYKNLLQHSNEDFWFNGNEFVFVPDFTEIIGKGQDDEFLNKTKISSLSSDSKSEFLKGLSREEMQKAMNQKILLHYYKDRVNLSGGFIPNFAPPTSAIRIPWFKKFGNPAFDTIQPALGISKASDIDTFRQVNFRSTAEGADEKGDSNIFGPLYETFSRKALQLINKSNIFGEFVRGSALQPKAISSQTAFDEALLQKEGIVAFDFKGFPKKNLSSGSVTKHLNDKFNRVVKTDPEKAAKIKESIMAFNETGHESQLPSQFGKNFLELAGTSYSQMLKNSPSLVEALSAETDSLLNNYVKNPAFLAMAAASGFIPNFEGKKISTKFFRTKTGFGNVFSGEEGTGLSGTVYRQPGFKSYGYQLKEQLNNMVMSILGNNVFIPDTSYINPRLTDDVNAYAEFSARVAALRLSSGGKTKSLGMERGMMSEAFGNSRYVFNPNSVYTGQVSGRMKRINYDRLSDVLGVFWSSNPETKSAWEYLKSLSESGKYEDKEKIRPKTALLKKAYNDWLAKNQYIGTRVKLSDYRQGAEGVRGANYAALRSDLAGVSNLQNLGEIEKLKKYKEQGIFYGDYKNNKAMYDKMGRWTYNAASKKMILNSASGFIPNLADVGVLTGDSLKGAAYKQALQFLADTNKPISSIIGPAGSGKTTRAVSQYGGEIMTGTDFNKYSSYVFDRAGFEVPQKDVVSAENIKKIIGKSNMIDILIGSRSTIKSAREKRVAQGDLNIPGRTGLQGGNKGIRGFTKAVREFAKNNPQARILRMLLNEDGTFSHQEIGSLKSALGFIPNFAYKQAVMGLEESMSGNKAIFDTKPFPHIRNSSQPTFSSAIADHGGLSNALSDSMRGQKAAGLMSKGFIPNFADFDIRGTPLQRSASVGGGAVSYNKINKAVNDYIKSIDLNTTTNKQISDALTKLLPQFNLNQQSFNEVRKAAIEHAKAERQAAQQTVSNTSQNTSRFARFNKSLSAAFDNIGLLGPMIAGQLESFIVGNKKRIDMTENERMLQSGLSTGVTALTTGADIGNRIIPGLGAAFGAAIGGLIGLTAALDAAKLTAEDLMELNQEQTQKAQANISAASSYVEAQKSLTDMVAKGASSTEIETATKNLANNFSQIKDTKLQEMFLAAGGDVAIMTRQLQEYTNQVSKESAKQTGLFGQNLTPQERASALSVGLGKSESKKFIDDFKKTLQEAEKARKTAKTKQEEIIADLPERRITSPVSASDKGIQAYNEVIRNFIESIIPQNTKDRSDKVRIAYENFLKNPEEFIKELEKSVSISDISEKFANFNKVATESYSAIFERIANNLQKQNFDLEKRFISATGENKIQNTILEFSTGFNSFLDSFLSDTLDEFSKLQMAPQVATRKYTEGLNKIQLNNNKFQIDQEKAKNDFLEKNASKLTDTFKSSILQSQQNAQYFETQLLPQIQKGDYSFDLTSVLNDLNQQNLKQAKQTIEESGIQGLEKLDLTSAGGRESALKTLTEKSKNLGDNAEEAAKKIYTAIQAVNSLSKSAEFLTNINAQKSIEYAAETAKQEKIKFDANQKYLEEENRIRSSFEAARLKAETDLAVKKAEVDKGILLRLRAMRELVDELQVRSAISAARGSAQAQLTEARVQDPFRILGQGIRSNTEETIRLENQAIQERRKVEDATLNDQIQQAAIEIATREANTTALQNLTNAVFELTNNILKEQMGGSYEEMKKNPYIGMSNEQLSKAKDIADIRVSSISTTAADRALAIQQKEQIAQLKSYSPEQTSAFKAYQQLQQQRPGSLGGYDFSEYKKDLLNVDPKNQLTQQQISDITSNFESRAAQLGVSQSEAAKLMQDQQTLSIYQQLETIRNRALVSKTKESDKIAEDTKALQNRLIKEKDILVVQRDIGDRIKKNTDEYKRMQSTFGGNFVIGVASLRGQSEELINTLGRDLPKMFGDGLVDGIKAAIRESNNLGEALMGIASKFLDEMSTIMMRSAIYGLLGSFGMNIPGISNAAAAGGLKQKGGYIRAQSGMYISGTGSGDKYPALLENGEYVLNRNAVMAMGGPAEIDKLNFSMAPRFAAGGTFTSNFDDISSMESNMTSFGLEESKLYNELRDQRRAEIEAARQKKRAQRQQMAGLIGSLAGAAVSLGISAGINKFNQPTKLPEGGYAATPAGQLEIAASGDAGLSPEGLAIVQNQAVFATPKPRFGRRQIGGLIGSRLSDTVPTYATGGLVDNPIVKRYAIGGASSGVGYGGAIGNNSTINNNTNASNSFNFNTTVQRDGKIEIGANSTSYAQQDVELSQNLNSKVYEVVLDTIRKEKRFGGSLAGIRN